MDGNKVGFTSYDAGHIQGVLDEVILSIENHPILRSFKNRILRSPYIITARHGWNLEGINMNMNGKDPGSNFIRNILLYYI